MKILLKINKLFFSALIFFLFLTSCETNNNKRSLYIWNANLKITETDAEFFSENEISKLYIRLFDVEWTYQPEPISVLNFSGNVPQNIQIIPVVYIKNEVVKNISADDLKDFSDKLSYKINEIFSQSFPNHQITEIQIDCDWTESSRDKYFELLELLKAKTEKTISVTIRLHQVKYQQSSGIPPADKGVLMYYNMGDVTNPNEKNSILNNRIGEQYVNENSSYPLKLSLALPVYSWGLWYNWSNKVDVLYSININTINELDFLKNEYDNIYSVIQDTVIDEKYLRIGDKIRLESVTLAELVSAKQICEPILPRNYEIILYSYKTQTSNMFNYEKLEKIYNSN